MARRRTPAGEALARPAMTATPVDAKATVRITVDLPRDVHRDLRKWVVEAGLDASVLILGLLDTAGDDPAVRVRAEQHAQALMRARRLAVEARR